MAKKRLSIIYTGGTIAMVEGNDGKLRPPKDPREFERAIPQLFEEYLVSFRTLLNKDSTDMQPCDWMAINETILNERAKEPDGIVVVHGVDTICFSASAAAFALGPSLDVPVVFTGAQLPSKKSFGDALINLLRSAMVATSGEGQNGRQSISTPKEVMILFDTEVFRAVRTQKKDDKSFNAMEAPTLPPLVLIKDPLEINPFLAIKDAKHNKEPYHFMNRFSTGILPVMLSPGNRPFFFEKAVEQDECKGIVLISYGGATIPNLPEYHYMGIISRATELGKPILVASHYPTTATDPDLYASGTEAKNRGAIPVAGYVLPALIAKFSWILAYTEKMMDFEERHKLISRIMKSVYVGEMNYDNFTTEDMFKTLHDCSGEYPLSENALESLSVINQSKKDS